MFYPDFIVRNRAHLGIFWLAAHCPKYLKKSEIVRANLVEGSAKVLSIVNGEELVSASSNRRFRLKFALRLSSEMLYGLLYVYGKKADFLNKDAFAMFNDMFKPKPSREERQLAIPGRRKRRRNQAVPSQDDSGSDDVTRLPIMAEPSKDNQAPPSSIFVPPSENSEVPCLPEGFEDNLDIQVQNLAEITMVEDVEMHPPQEEEMVPGGMTEDQANRFLECLKRPVIIRTVRSLTLATASPPIADATASPPIADPSVESAVQFSVTAPRTPTGRRPRSPGLSASSGEAPEPPRRRRRRSPSTARDRGSRERQYTRQPFIDIRKNLETRANTSRKLQIANPRPLRSALDLLTMRPPNPLISINYQRITRIDPDDFDEELPWLELPEQTFPHPAHPRTASSSQAVPIMEPPSSKVDRIAQPPVPSLLLPPEDFPPTSYGDTSTESERPSYTAGASSLFRDPTPRRDGSLLPPLPPRGEAPLASDAAFLPPSPPRRAPSSIDTTVSSSVSGCKSTGFSPRSSVVSDALIQGETKASATSKKLSNLFLSSEFQATTFKKLCPPSVTTRATAAKTFYDLIAMHQKKQVEVNQSEEYGEIVIQPGKRVNEII